MLRFAKPFGKIIAVTATYHFIAKDDPTIKITTPTEEFIKHNKWMDIPFDDNWINVEIVHEKTPLFIPHSELKIISVTHHGLEKFMSKNSNKYKEFEINSPTKMIIYPSLENKEFLSTSSLFKELQQEKVFTEIEFINHWGLQQKKVIEWTACVM